MWHSFTWSRVPSVSIFFPDRIWRFHNFMSVSCMKPSASFIFWCQKIRKIPTFFRQFHVKLCHNKKKISEVFFWNLIFYIKQTIKLRVLFPNTGTHIDLCINHLILILFLDFSYKIQWNRHIVWEYCQSKFYSSFIIFGSSFIIIGSSFIKNG